MGKNVVDWKSYYIDAQINEFNIRNTKIIRLFNTNDLTMEGDNQINYLNPYLGELPMMYYIWKNNLKSDYIKISQYRRDITVLDYDRLDKGKIQFYLNWPSNDIKLKDFLEGKHAENQIPDDPSDIVFPKWFEYLKEKYGFTNEQIYDIQNCEHFECIAAFVFGCTWKTYCKLCDLIFGFLDYLFPNESWKDIDTLEAFRERQRKYYEDNCEKIGDRWAPLVDKRYVVFLIETLVGKTLDFIIPVFSNNLDKYILLELDENMDPKDFYKIKIFYKKNVRFNPTNIYIKTVGDLYDKVYHYFHDECCMWHFYRIEIINDDIDLEGKEIIKLNIDEYIDFEDFDDLYLNNKQYQIKNIYSDNCQYLTIYKSYHDDNLINSFNLRNDENHMIFNTNKAIVAPNLNFISKVINEAATMFYVWKNNIKSKFVGFEPYNREFVGIIDNLKEDQCQVYFIDRLDDTIENQYIGSHNKEDFDILVDIIEKKYGTESRYINYLKNSLLLATNESYIMSWDNFCNMCKFVFDIFFEFDKRIGCNLCLDNYFKRYQNEKMPEYSMRAFYIERLISAYILCNFEAEKILRMTDHITRNVANLNEIKEEYERS